MLAVVQCASSDGGSPRLPTRIAPPLRGVSAARAPAATSRIAAMASNAFRTGTERLMRVPPGGVWQRVRRLCSGAGTLVNGRVGREEARGRRRNGGEIPRRRGEPAPSARGGGCCLRHGDGRAVSGRAYRERSGRGVRHVRV